MFGCECECVFRTPIYNLSQLSHALHPVTVLFYRWYTHKKICFTLSHMLCVVRILSLSIFISLLLPSLGIVLLIIMPSKQPPRQQYANIFIEYMNMRCDAMRYSHANRVRIAITLFVYEHQVRANTQHFIRFDWKKCGTFVHSAHTLLHTKAHQMSP